jgi:hypothetical protein
VRVDRSNGTAWVLKQALAKLRTKVDWFSDPARIHREALALRHLPELVPQGSITPLIFEDEDAHLICMEAVPEPHENWKTMLLAGRVEPGHVEQFARMLAGIHGGSARSADALQPVFADRSFFETLRIEPFYAYPASRVDGSAGFLDRLIDECRASAFSLVHGDFSPKNVLVRDGRLILLDHEVSHWGDPAFDIGFAMAHLLSKAHHLANAREAFVRAARRFWQTYCTSTGMAPWKSGFDSRAARHALGCLLARVAGRSTLEYLNDEARRVQRDAVVEMMTSEEAPADPGEVIDGFVGRVRRGG